MFTNINLTRTAQSRHTLMSKSWVFGASVLGIVALMTGCTGNSPGGYQDPVPPPPTTPPTSDGTSPPSDQSPTPENVTIAKGQDFNITRTDIISVDCDGGGEINVLIDGAQFTVTGSCEEIDVNGHNNVIDIFDTNDLDIDGDNNKIQAKNIMDIDISGSNNMVDAASVVTEVDVEGSNNSVSFVTGNPKVEDKGTENMIKQG